MTRSDPRLLFLGISQLVMTTETRLGDKSPAAHESWGQQLEVEEMTQSLKYLYTSMGTRIRIPSTHVKGRVQLAYL